MKIFTKRLPRNAKKEQKPKKPKRNKKYYEIIDNKTIKLFDDDHIESDKKILNEQINNFENSQEDFNNGLYDTANSDVEDGNNFNKKIYTIYRSKDIMKFKINIHSKSSADEEFHTSHIDQNTQNYEKHEPKIEIDNNDTELIENTTLNCSNVERTDITQNYEKHEPKIEIDNNDTELIENTTLNCSNVERTEINTYSKSSVDEEFNILHTDLNAQNFENYEKHELKIEIDNNDTELIENTTINCFNVEITETNTQINTEKKVFSIDFSDEDDENIEQMMKNCYNFESILSNIDVIDDVEEEIKSPMMNSDIQENRIQTSPIIFTLKNAISSIINMDDQINKNILIENIAELFSTGNDILMSYSVNMHFDLVSDYIIKLIEKYNNTRYNIVKLSCCLVCVFHKIKTNTLIPPNNMKLKFVQFINVIEKIILIYDKNLWKKWFLPNIFLDWCFVLITIFVSHENDIGILVMNDQFLISGAIIYFNAIKNNHYSFIKTRFIKPLPSKGIFEFSRSDDDVEFDTNLKALAQLSKIHTNKPKDRNYDFNNLLHVQELSKKDTIEFKDKNNELEVQDIQRTNQMRNQTVGEEIYHGTPKRSISDCVEFSNSNFKKKSVGHQTNHNKSLGFIQTHSDTNENLGKNLNFVRPLECVNSNMSQNNLSEISINTLYIDPKSSVDQQKSITAKRSLSEMTRTDDIFKIDHLSKARILSKEDTNKLKDKNNKLDVQSLQMRNQTLAEEMYHGTPKRNITVCREFNLTNFKNNYINNQPNLNKALGLRQTNSNTNEDLSLNLNIQPLESNMAQYNFPGISYNTSNIDEISSVDNKTSIASKNMPNVDTQVAVSLLQEINTAKNSDQQSYMPYSRNNSFPQYYNNILSNMTTQSPINEQYSHSIYTQPNQTYQTSTYNNIQLNNKNIRIQSNNTNVNNIQICNSKNSSASSSRNILDKQFPCPATIKLSSQQLSSAPSLFGFYNPLSNSTNLNYTQPSSVSVNSTVVSSRVNKGYDPNCNLTTSHMTSTIPLPSTSFQTYNSNYQALPDLPNAQTPNIPNQRNFTNEYKKNNWK